MKATYTKCKGSWAVFIVLDKCEPVPPVGSEVTVTKKSGETKVEKVFGIIGLPIRTESGGMESTWSLYFKCKFCGKLVPPGGTCEKTKSRHLAPRVEWKPKQTKTP